MKDKPQTIGQVEGLKNLLEIVAKVFFGLTVVCYAIGLIVVNISLSKYGVFSLSILRVSYVTAGAWAIFFLLAPALVFVIFWFFALAINPALRAGWLSGRSLYRPTQEEQERLEELTAVKRRRLFRLTDALLTVGATSLLLLPFFGLWLTSGDESYGIWLIALILGAMIDSILFTLWTLVRWVRSAPHATFAFFAPLTGLGVILLAAIIAYPIIFGYLVYNTIPSQLGGGSPTAVQLVIDADPTMKAFLTNAGVNFQKDTNQIDTNLTDLVLLLFVTEDDYIIVGTKLVNDNTSVASSNSSAVSIPRKDVKAVRYSSSFSLKHIKAIIK